MENSENVAVSEVKKSRKKLQWTEVQTVRSLAEAEEFIRKTGDFSYRSSDKSEMNRFYRCKHVKRRGPQCAAKMRVFFPSNSLDIILYETEDKHTHGEMCTDKIGLRPETKSEILSLHEKGLPPSQIWRQLKGQITNRQQLYNFLAHTKRKGKICETMDNFKNWCQENSDTADDENKT